MGYTFKDYGNREDWEKARDPFSPDGIQGLGTSEAANACGHGYGTPLELWEEKTGLKEPFRGNEFTERGKLNEPAIRAWFAMNFKQFRIRYSEFGVYISDELPLFSTLDGELEVVEDCDFPVLHGVTGQQCFLHLKKGMKGILEIKDTEPQTEESYIRWNSVPEPYRYQVAGQNICRGGVFTILVAHITGPYAHGADPIFHEQVGECRVFGFDMPADLADVQADIRAQLPSFWECVKERRNPGMTIYDEKSESLVTFSPVVKVGQILNDFEGAKESVQLFADRFKGLSFDDSQLKEAKAAQAELNAYIDSIKKMRTSVKKEWEAPLNDFYGRCDELISVVNEAKIPISDQIAETEARRQKEKKARCEGLWKMKLETLKTADPDAYHAAMMIGLRDDPRWLNATTSMKKVGEDMDGQISRIRNELETLKVLGEDDEDIHSALMQEYLAAGDINKAIRAKDRILEAPRIAASSRVTPAPGPEAFEEDHIPGDDQADNADAAVEPEQAPWQEAPPEKSKGITITIRFTHTDKDAFKGLLGYMKDHGFAYELVE